MDLENYREHVRMLAPAEATNVSNNRLNRLINDTYREICSMYRWPFLIAQDDISTTDSTQNVALPADFNFMLAVYEDGESRRAIPEVTADFYFTQFGDSDTESDRADVYFILNDEIWFYPIPSASVTDQYHIVYYSTPTELTNDSDEPAFPQAFHQIITDGVVATLYNTIGALEQSNNVRGRYFGMINDMRRYYNRQHDNSPLIFGDGNRYRYHLDPNIPFLDTI